MAWISGNYYLNQQEMENNALIIWNSLSASGWSINAVSAMLGNMQSESSINPGIWEGLVVDYVRGYGLVQWTPATKYINWAGSDWENPDRELDRINYEVENNIQWFENPGAPIIIPPISFTEFKTSDLPVATLANYFLWYYEHPADINQPWRATQAESWYTFLSGHPPEPPMPTTSKMSWIYYLKLL